MGEEAYGPSSPQFCRESKTALKKECLSLKKSLLFKRKFLYVEKDLNVGRGKTTTLQFS